MTDDMGIINVLGVCGSLRKSSYNRMALAAAAELSPETVAVDICDLAGIPPYDDDVFREGFPPAVAAFRERIAKADALVIATPEYNFSVPGVLKNAIDWASRPPDQPLNGKPLAVIGASPGMFGTARAQIHLRQVCAGLNMLVLNKPDILIASAAEKFDEDGRLTDEATRGFLGEMLVALERWTRTVRAGK